MRTATISSDSTLGEIVYFWRRKGATDEALKPLVLQFGDRPDFCCWFSFYAMSRKNTLFKDSSLAESLDKALDSALSCLSEPQNPCMAWCGIAAVTSAVLRIPTLQQMDENERFTKRIHNVLDNCSGFADKAIYLENSKESCAFIRFMLKHVKENIRIRSEYHGLKSAGKYLDFIEARMKEIDPKWILGSSANILTFKSNRKILPYAGLVDINYNIADALYQCRAVAQKACSNESHTLENHHQQRIKLLYHGMLFARSAWLMHRAQRLQRGNTTRNNVFPPHAEPQLDEFEAKARDKELKALMRYAQSANDAGYPLIAGRANWILFQFLEQKKILALKSKIQMLGWIEGSNYDGMRGKFRESLDQIGLEVPISSRAYSSKSTSISRHLQKTPIIESVEEIPNLDSPVVVEEYCLDIHNKSDTRKHSQVNKCYPHDITLGFDFEASEDWKLLKVCENSSIPCHPISLLMKVRKSWQALCDPKNAYPDIEILPSTLISPEKLKPEVLRAAFRLSLKYMRIGDANWYLKRTDLATGTENDGERHAWDIQAVDLLLYAIAVCQATAILPMALAFEKHKNWRDRLTRVWSAISDAFSIDDLLLLHESVHGCCTKLCSRSPIGNLICQQYLSGDLADFDLSDKALGSKWSPLNSTQLVSMLQRFGSEKNNIIAVSVTALRENGFSICVVSKSGHTASSYITSVNLPMIQQHLEDQLTSCTNGMSQEFDCSEGPLHDLVREIDCLLNSIGINGGMILLAIDPELASVPWNLLVRNIQPDFLVSVIPSLHWLDMRSTMSRCQTTYLICQRDQLVRDEITKSEIQLLDILRDKLVAASNDQNRSLKGHAFVLGHGCLSQVDDKDFRTVYGPDGPISMEMWLDIATQHDFIIIHGCMTGRVGEKLLGDMSGIPGLSLMAGSKLVISPVVDIGATTATILQEKIVGRSSAMSIADAYLNALNACPDVALYNLYGIPIPSRN